MWGVRFGAIDFAHWFFPLRGGGGAVGGMLGAFKRDTLIDLDFSSKFVTKPMKAASSRSRGALTALGLSAPRAPLPRRDRRQFLPQRRPARDALRRGFHHMGPSLSTFRDGQVPLHPLRTWSRESFMCGAEAFVTHFGKCIDEKTPLRLGPRHPNA